MIPIAILLLVLGFVNYSRVSTIKEKIQTEQDQLVLVNLTKKKKATTLNYKVMFVCAGILLIAGLILLIV